MLGMFLRLGGKNVSRLVVGGITLFVIQKLALDIVVAISGLKVAPTTMCNNIFHMRNDILTEPKTKLLFVVFSF